MFEISKGNFTEAVRDMKSIITSLNIVKPKDMSFY